MTDEETWPGPSSLTDARPAGVGSPVPAGKWPQASAAADRPIADQPDLGVSWSRRGRHGPGRSALLRGLIEGLWPLVDLAVLIAAALLTSAAAGLLAPAALAAPAHWSSLGLLMSAAAVGALSLTGSYRLIRLRATGWQARRIALVLLTLLVLTLVPAPLLAPDDLLGLLALAWAVLGGLTLFALRRALAALLEHGQRTGRLRRRLAVVGVGPSAQALISHLRLADPHAYDIVGVYDDRSPGARVPCTVEGVPVRGSIARLLDDARADEIATVVVTLPSWAHGRLHAVLSRLQEIPADVVMGTDLIGLGLPLRTCNEFGRLPVLRVWRRPMSDGAGLAKLATDKVLALAGLLLTAPLMLLLAVAIKLDSQGPVLFRQPRFGFNNQAIEVLKFRTMYAHLGDRTGGQRTTRGDPRVTRVGRWLRRTSLDELPQLINVLRGDMSIVGPRPHPIRMTVGEHGYHEAVPAYPARHRVRPGITGWAQINGSRGEVATLEDARRRVDLDLEYIERWSFWLDLRILALTPLKAWIDRNAY